MKVFSDFAREPDFLQRNPKGDAAEAIFDYKKAIELNPDNTEALKHLHKLEHP